MINDIISRYKAIFKEKDWIANVIIGGIVFIFSIGLIGLPLLLGYFMNLFEQLKDKKKCVLPKWQNFEKLFMDGLPVALFLVTISFIISLLGLFIGLLGCIGAPISLLLNLAYGVICPAIIVIAMFRMNELLNWKEAFVLGAFIEDLQKNITAYLPTLIAMFVLSILSFFIGMLGCGLPIPFLLFITSVALYPLLAEIYIKKHALKESFNISEKESTSSENVVEAEIVEKSEVPIENVEKKEGKDSSDKKEDTNS